MFRRAAPPVGFARSAAAATHADACAFAAVAAAARAATGVGAGAAAAEPIRRFGGMAPSVVAHVPMANVSYEQREFPATTAQI